MQQGILCLRHGGGKEDAFQSLVHLAHPIGGGCQQRVQECSRCGLILGGPSEGGELPLCLFLCHGLACLQR
jgi:hypothetical protein